MDIPARQAARKKGMNLSYFLKSKLLPIVVNRTVIFFLLMCLLTLAVYTAGTSQGFIDSTQFSLLKLYTVFGIFLTVTSVYGTLLDLARYLGSKKIRYLVRSGGYLLLVIFGTVSVLAVFFIITLSEGTR